MAWVRVQFIKCGTLYRETLDGSNIFSPRWTYTHWLNSFFNACWSRENVSPFWIDDSLTTGLKACSDLTNSTVQQIRSRDRSTTTRWCVLPESRKPSRSLVSCCAY